MANRSSENEALHVLFMLQRRNMQLWAITTIVMVSLAAGLLSVTWHPAWYPADWHRPAFLPQAMVGLVVLIVLLSGYLLDQKRRAAVAERGLFGDVLSSCSANEFLDSETNVFQHTFLDYALGQEKTLAALEGTPTCAVLVRVLQYIPQNLRGKYGSEGGFMGHAGYLLRRTFRGSDTIVRESDTGFLVLMSNTTSEEARCALNRLMESVNKWNLSARYNYELVLSWQVVCCAPEEDLDVAVKMLRTDNMEEERSEEGAQPAVTAKPTFATLVGTSI
jgi:GGDEF domain-containing protein